MIHGEMNRHKNLEYNVKETLFVSTFSKNGYHVYGKQWIETFLEKTKDYPNIKAKIFIDNMTVEEMNEIAVANKLEIVDYNNEIPEQQEWVENFETISKHHIRVKELSIKFSFKGFVIAKALKDNSDKYVIWLDADCIFKSSDLVNFAENLLNGKFMACQKEAGTDHVESGIIIFDTAHPDRQKFIDTFVGFYYGDVNSFGEFYDGFIVNRTLAHSQIDYVNLNEMFGLTGVQSDPGLTFLHPEISKRFLHNIGITGKRQYEDWVTYARQDKYFQLIHGIDPFEMRESIREKVNKVNNIVLGMARQRNVR